MGQVVYVKKKGLEAWLKSKRDFRLSTELLSINSLFCVLHSLMILSGIFARFIFLTLALRWISVEYYSITQEI